MGVAFATFFQGPCKTPIRSTSICFHIYIPVAGKAMGNEFFLFLGRPSVGLYTV